MTFVNRRAQLFIWKADAAAVMIGLVSSTVVVPPLTGAQQPRTVPLVFEKVTVVDVEHGTLIPNQRVIVVGNRIRAVGDARTVSMPAGAEVVDSRGKYLIPGLWDMHVHVDGLPEIFYPLSIANGVTGIREMSTPSLDSLQQWRREILAGTRVGPRTLSPGPLLDTPEHAEALQADTSMKPSTKHPWGIKPGTVIGVATPADARRVVDSLRAAGADFIKVHGFDFSREVYFAIAAAARRVGLPYAGHLPYAVTALEASDSGQRSIEHLPPDAICLTKPVLGIVDYLTTGPVNEAACAQRAARFLANGSWMVPTFTLCQFDSSIMDERERYWPKSWLSADEANNDDMRIGVTGMMADALPDKMRAMRQLGISIIAGSDISKLCLAAAPGFALHHELDFLVHQADLSPLEALQAATLNPAKYLRATDSLGTVVPNKLADLVLLDADPLVDIANTMKIRAVVANGRYFDRAALDALLLEVQAKSQRKP